MAARGPLPSPFSLPTLRGANTFAATQAEPPEADVPPPPWLAADALSIWEEQAPPLIASGRLRSASRETFAVYCELASDCQRLSREVAEEGDVIGMKANPKCRLLRDARRDLLSYSKAFGLDAASNARLPSTPAETQPTNPLLAFAAKRGA
jgi:P27 family predicted phage terminase small subunit